MMNWTRASFALLLCLGWLCLCTVKTDDNPVVFIEKTGDNPWVKHGIPGYVDRYMWFGPVFDKDFLKQVLDLKMKAQNVSVVLNDTTTITYGQICETSSRGRCIVESLWDYFQDNTTNIDKVVWNSFHEFRMGTYLDHVLACFEDPFATNDRTALAMSCIGEHGLPTPAQDILADFPGTLYKNATKLAIPLHLRSELTPAVRKAWLLSLGDFVKNANSQYPGMVITAEIPD